MQNRIRLEHKGSDMANHCKVFTTSAYAKELLDAADYRCGLFGRRVLENSCGDGHVLMEIVRRYISDCIARKMPLSLIKNGLERDITGYELEREHYENCIRNLNETAAQYHIENIKWDIHLSDALRSGKGKFCYVLGNPPYITYKDLEDEEKTYIRANFSTCRKGKFDYYYAFVEDGLRSLQDHGILAYIIPSSIYKNVSANDLRALIKEDATDVYDYTSEKKFKNAVTSSTILVLKKNSGADHLRYHDVLNRKSFAIRKELLQNKWNFVENETVSGEYRFGDYFKISNCIATLCNEAFIVDEYEEMDGGYRVGDYILEPQLIRNACSMKSIRSGRRKKIIFPYHVINGIPMHIEEEEFQRRYPGVYAHLYQFKEKLLRRKSEKTVAWYEYGRSQAIRYMQEKKLMIPSVLTGKVECAVLDEDTIPYAGFYIRAGKEMTLQRARQILESQEFWEYISKRSINSTGRSKRVSVKEIQNYMFCSVEG